MSIQLGLRQMGLAKQDLLPPVSRVQTARGCLRHLAFMLANAGVSVDRMDLGTGDAQLVMMGVGMDLLAGKPLGIHPHMLVVRWAGAACRPE